MIHEEICIYEVCKLAKDKGFDEECRDFYCNDKRQKRITRTSCNRQVTSFDYCSNSTLEDYDSPKEYFHIAAPTQSLLQRWLREEKNIHIEIVATACGYYWIADKTNGTAITDSDILDRGTNEGGCFDTYELALEDALKYALENLV